MIQRVKLLLVVVPMVGLLSGCLGIAMMGAAAAGGAAYAYVDGSMEHTYKAIIADVHDAARKTLEKDMNYTVTADTPTDIEARTASNRKVKLEMKYLSNETTQVSMRVGVFGDRELSYMILKQMGEYLGKPNPGSP